MLCPGIIAGYEMEIDGEENIDAAFHDIWWWLTSLSLSLSFPLIKNIFIDWT